MSKLILDLDVGNSTTKWRLTGLNASRLNNQDIEQLKDFVEIVPGRVRVACVSSDDFRVRLTNILRQNFDCEPEFAESPLFCAGLHNGYEKPETLGVDRWLAGLAVWMQENRGPCLVIDAGSALTIDTVDEKGLFRGGYIVPGLAAMQQSLVNNMGKITCGIERDIHKNFRQIPMNTQQAVQWGACFAMIAIIEKAIDVFLLQWPRGTVRITGGNGESVAMALNKAEVYRPDLVLDGLALALS